VIEPFGGQTFLVKGVPAVSGEKFDLHELLDTLSEVLLNPTDKRGGLERGIQHRLAAAAACKSSVRAGDRLQVKDCESLLKQLSNCLAPYTCPHGRPTIIRLPYSELEHRFRRK
jgi:DNA mismatch repair protein MutL